MAANSIDKGNKCQRLCRQNGLLILLICLMIIGIIVGTLLLFVIPAIFKKEQRPYRLPADVIPYQYVLEIKPYLTPNNFSFEGRVEIYVICARKTDLIVLHAKNLTIDEDNVKVSSMDSRTDFKVLLIGYDLSNDLLLLRLLEDLKERRTYRIGMNFKGSLEEREDEGFYVSSYKDDEDVVHYIASTHFEPVGARTTFPCFDEPEFKSVFNITLVRWKNMTSLSNMPRMRTKYRGENWEADIFEESMRMSTYLVAFIFSDYVGMTKGKITVWAPKHRIQDAQYALNISEKALTFYEEKLGISYPGPKLDMVPVPYLEAAAMENWGLIIFYESVLLTPEDKTIINSGILMEIAATVSHEIAHQWFGNLVTIKWWSDIWLNEGITSYMENLAEAEIHPNWYKVDPTISTAYGYIYEDCSKSVPIWQPVLNSTDASNSFDGGTYPKGSMITRMAHQILGEKVFWNGIKRYLDSSSYGNVEEADLWRYLTAAQLPGSERLDMAEVMYSWTHLSGIPVVTVRRDYTRRTAIISQKSCKSDRKEYENDLWKIPIIIETKYAVNLFNKILWLNKRNMTVDGMPDEDVWIVVNGDSTGFYIVNYDRENWNLLSNQMRMNHELFDVTQRYKFVEEIIKLERMGDIEIDVVFDYFIYLREEKDFEVFPSTFEFLYDYLSYFDEEKYHELLKEFLIYIWANIYDDYGWKERKDYANITIFSEIIGSSLLTRNLCALDYEPCVEEAVDRYLVLKHEETIVDYRYLVLKREETIVNYENLLNPIALCTVMRNATYEEWSQIKNTHFNEYNKNLSFALTCSNDASVIRSELNLLLEDNKGISFNWLSYAASSYKASFYEALNFLDENFEKLAVANLETGWNKDLMINGLNPSRMKKIIEMLSKHLRRLSGSIAQILEIYLEFLKKRLPQVERKTIILKRWLEEKRWL